MPSSSEGRVRLAQRLRALRLECWPGRRIRQDELAGALAVGPSSISTWESRRQPKIPPADRLEAYATFFATERSVAAKPYRVLPLGQLAADERVEQARLLRELLELREAAVSTRATGDQEPAEPVRGLWHFPEGEDITIVCARLPRRLFGLMPYADPDSPDYVKAYTYADTDALIESYGQICAMNPLNQVTFRVGSDLGSDDYTSHLVLLGGVDFNDATRDVLRRFGDLPVRQLPRDTEEQVGGFEVRDDGSRRTFLPKLRKDGEKTILEEDIAHVFWAPNPYNDSRTVTVCNGTYGRGVYGAVRAITDPRMRDHNQGYINSRFAGGNFSILSRVVILAGEVITPSWSVPEHRLHEWPVAG